jgi:spore protease
LVIAVDALAARSPARLCATVQLCDSGIQPGSGVARSRLALTKETLGVPVMALGVPTVIRCSTLIADALGEELWQAFACRKDVQTLFVCPGEIDLIVRRAAGMLAVALGKAFCT